MPARAVGSTWFGVIVPEGHPSGGVAVFAASVSDHAESLMSFACAGANARLEIRSHNAT
jgi:hypothetical protein